MTAYLTKVLLEKPWRVIDLALRFPASLGYALRSGSSLVSEPSASYPKELTALQRRDLFNGPTRYLRGRYRFPKTTNKR